MNLVQFITIARRAIPVLIGVLIIAIVMLFIGLQISRYNAIQKAKKIVLNPIFGKIDPLEIENKLPYPQNPVFVLDNIEGKPIVATSAANIYFLPPTRAKYNYLETIYGMARIAGFDTTRDRHNLNGIVAQFENNKHFLQINIGNFNFTYSYHFDIDESIFEKSTITQEENYIIQTATDYLTKMGRMPQELLQGKTKVIYLTYNSSRADFEVVEHKKQATVVEVDFYRSDINETPSISPKYYNSYNYVTIAYPNGRPTIVKSQIKFYDRDEGIVGSYPLKTGQEAWNEFVNKKGFIVANQNPSEKIIITNMFLAYLDTSVYIQHLQPVYVFTGDNNFAGYIPAVNNIYVDSYNSDTTL